MRKFLRNFFWSHGAPLGYLGSLSQKGHPEIFSKWVLINLSNPLRHPAPLVDPLLTKKLDTAGPWCALICLGNRIRTELMTRPGKQGKCGGCFHFAEFRGLHEKCQDWADPPHIERKRAAWTRRCFGAQKCTKVTINFNSQWLRHTFDELRSLSFQGIICTGVFSDI